MNSKPIATYHFTKPIDDYKDWETIDITIELKKETYTLKSWE